MAEKRMAWIDQRQSVLVQNVANANTPGYVASDIKPFSAFLAAQAQLPEGASAPGRAAQPVKDTVAAGRSPDGNAVVLDDQLEKIAETDTAQQLSMNLYKKYVGMFKTAIGHS